MPAAVELYPYPDVLPQAASVSLFAEGVRVPVYALDTTCFAPFALHRPFDLVLRYPEPVGDAVIRPSRLGIQPEVEGCEVRFPLEKPADLCVEVANQKALFLYVDAPADRDTGDADVRFEAGKVHDVGALNVTSGQRVVIEPGAIVRGVVRAADAEDITLAGRGILDGQYVADRRTARTKLVQLEGCRNVHVDGWTMIRPSAWMLALADCEQAEVSRLRQIGEVVTSDGVDIVGSRHVHVHDCCLRNNDDCIAIKAIAGGDYGFAASDPAKDVHDVLVERCSFWNARAGNVMEIGFETRCEVMHNIVFRNNDVLAAHGEGGIFTIHAGDRARIHHVLYEDIRIEHLYGRLIDFQVLQSRYSRDTERGRIHDITLRNIRSIADRFNTLNLLGGYDDDHRVKRVHITDFRLGDRPVETVDDLALFTRHADDPCFA